MTALVNCISSNLHPQLLFHINSLSSSLSLSLSYYLINVIHEDFNYHWLWEFNFLHSLLGCWVYWRRRQWCCSNGENGEGSSLFNYSGFRRHLVEWLRPLSWSLWMDSYPGTQPTIYLFFKCNKSLYFKCNKSLNVSSYSLFNDIYVNILGDLWQTFYFSL